MNGPRRDDLLAHGRDHLALVGGAAEVAVLVDVPGPGVGQRGRPVGLLAALLHVEVRQLVLHVLLRADLHAADGVDHVDDAAEADLDVVVDADPGVLLDRLHQQLRAAVGVGGVDLRGAVAGDVDRRVAGDRHQQVRAGAGVQQHDRVGALADRVAGAELLALLGAQAGPRVAADHEVRRAGLVGRSRPAGLEVDLVHLRPREQRHRHQPYDPQQQQDQQPAGPEARPAGPTGGAAGRSRGPARRRRGRRARGTVACRRPLRRPRAGAGDRRHGPGLVGARLAGHRSGRVVVRRRRPCRRRASRTGGCRRRVRRHRAVGQPCGNATVPPSWVSRHGGWSRPAPPGSPRCPRPAPRGRWWSPGPR